MSWWRRRLAAKAAVSRPAAPVATDPELAGLYQVYDRTTRKWDVIDPDTGILKSKGGGPWPAVDIRKVA